MTALREANQAGSLQPTTLVSYDAEIADVFDCRDEEALKAEGMDAAALADTTWRDQMKATGEARAQSFARRLMGKGFRARWSEASRRVQPRPISISYSGTGARHRRRASL